MFDTVLVANRGEIAVRVIRTLRALGSARSRCTPTPTPTRRHVARGATSRCGSARPRRELPRSSEVIAAARATGARGDPPRLRLPRREHRVRRGLRRAGMVFVGPPASAIEAMGDKIRAKRTVAAAGVPVVPGRTGRA